MVDRTALLASFDEYARALLHPYDIGEVLYRLTDQVVSVLDVDGAGVSIARNERLSFLTATDAQVAVVEEFQATHGHGPCAEAFATGQQVCIADVTEDDPRGGFRDVALAQGFHAVAALPMPVHERRIGALELYRRSPHEWQADEISIAQLLANMASGYVLNNIQLSETRTLAEQLQLALDSRIIVEQAKGILGGRHEMPPNEAFELLRAHARRSSADLHEVCEQVVAGTLRL